SQDEGFSASAGGAGVLFASPCWGSPGPKTRTIPGCVIGGGAARRAAAVRWGVARNVALAWVITIPASATVAALFYWLISGYYVPVLIAVGLISFVVYSAGAWKIQS